MSTHSFGMQVPWPSLMCVGTQSLPGETSLEPLPLDQVRTSGQRPWVPLGGAQHVQLLSVAARESGNCSRQWGVWWKEPHLRIPGARWMWQHFSPTYLQQQSKLAWSSLAWAASLCSWIPTPTWPSWHRSCEPPTSLNIGSYGKTQDLAALCHLWCPVGKTCTGLCYFLY